MPNGEQGLAQSVYLAQLYAQRKECQCTACQLLRKATDGMIQQMLGGQNPGQETLDPMALAKKIGGLGGSSGEVP